MALIKFDTSHATKPDLIIEVTVPVTISASAVDSVTFATSDVGGASTLEINWQTNWDSTAETEELTQLMLNAAIEASIADPHAIPVLSEICKEGGYLQPDECKAFIDYTYTT